MARQNIKPNPSEKLFEAYMDFSGGLNSETSNERLRDNEFPVLDNVDLSARGSAKRRTGRNKIFNITGNGQGLFYYYRKNQPKPDIILAVSGKIYRWTEGDTTPTEIVMKDGSDVFTFQTVLSVEAVQFGDDMIIATGIKLVELNYKTETTWLPETDYTVNTKVSANGKIYKCTIAGKSGTESPSHSSSTAIDGTVTWLYERDEWVAKTVEPYTPTVMEAIYLGGNALAPNPDSYVQDGVSSSLEVAGIKPTKRTGVVNQSQTFTAFTNKPAGITSVDYKWEYKKASEVSWTLARDWTNGTSGKSYNFIFNTATKWDIRVTARDNAVQTTTAQLVLTDYVVNNVEDKDNVDKPYAGIQKCRKILLHWDRIIISGDDTDPHQVYISDLNNPRYFPVTNTIPFDGGKRERITSLVKYRDYLVVFTKTTIHTLIGRSPDDYRKSMIHDGIGCIADRSAKVVGNNIYFLSSEGIQMLRPNQYIQETLNVVRIDFQIKSAVTQDVNACAMVHDAQYWLCFPSSSVMYRFYYDDGIWVRDKSSKLTFAEMSNYTSDVYELTTTGEVYKQNTSVHSDDGEAYDMITEAKFLDLSASFNYKKLKRLYVLARHFEENVDLNVKVMADSAIVLTPENGVVTIQDGKATWALVSEPNMHFYAGTVVGSWVLGRDPLGHVQSSVQKTSIRGKCRRVKVIFEHSEDSPCEIFGFGLEFKAKKP